MSEEIDALIARKEAELSPLLSSMDELKVEFTKETVIFATEWYRKTAKDYITKSPEVTLGLTEEGIGSMKADVNSLVKGANRTVHEEFDNPDLWWHLKPCLHESIERYKQVADKFPEVLDRAVRRVLGQLGVVLEKFGFRVTTSGYTGTYCEFWFERPEGSNQIKPCYPHLLNWGEAMQDTIRQYDVQYIAANDIYVEIQQLKSDRKKLEALSRWNSI
ncbi:MAG: hypothetical protein ACLQO7_13440 [Candidatus Bathyarchaeia archaeon]